MARLKPVVTVVAKTTVTAILEFGGCEAANRCLTGGGSCCVVVRVGGWSGRCGGDGGTRVWSRRVESGFRATVASGIGAVVDFVFLEFGKVNGLAKGSWLKGLDFATYLTT
jgi:hypothetical protein